jgi:hypothetical protein
MSSQLRRFGFLLEPCLGILFFVGWLSDNSAQIVTYVPLRSDTFTTNPYAVMIAVGFALAIGLSRISPVASFSIIGGLLLAQLLFWPGRFSQLSWDAYLALLFSASSSAHTPAGLFVGSGWRSRSCTR